MHVKALLVLLPLLLGPASSLAIPPAGNPCTPARLSGDTEEYVGNIPSHCGQRNNIENHGRPIKSEIVHEFGSGPLHPTLEARMPPKKGAKKPGKPAKENTPAKKTEPQGEPSGTQPETNPDSSAQKEKEKQKPEQPLTFRPKPDSQSPETKPETPGTQNQPENGEQVKKEPKENEPKKDEPKKDEDVPKKDEDVPKKDENEPKKDEPKKDDPKTNPKKNDPKDPNDPNHPSRTMYHIVTPDPNEFEGEKRIGTGKQSYDRKIGDGDPNGPSRYGTHLPNYSGVQSHGQEPGVSEKKAKETGQEQRFRPGEREERMTTGHDSKNADGKTLSEFHRISPKPQEQLDNEKSDKKAWGNEELRQNLIKQQEAFPNHKSEDKTDEYGKLTQEMLDMCNHEQCTRTDVQRKFRRAITAQPHLRRRFESLLRERNHLVTMAMR